MPRVDASNNSTWYKDAVIYELHPRAFYDSNGDGVGDFDGLCEKLDYLQDLGITALWLLPFYHSPLLDDGYDIADYTRVHEAYGTMGDFKVFLREAHRRGLRVITELVLNHTSDQHPWFQRARTSKPGSTARDFYVWSDSPDRYREARVIFRDYESSNWTWDPVAEAYYWHRFYSHQPDLNFDNPQVRKAMFKVVDYWLKMGVDGLRLDAVPYLFEHEGTTGENLPATHDFLRELRAHVDRRYRGRMLLAEANQWPEDAVAYFGKGDGDECHMAFHFPLMPRLFMGIRQEDRFPIVDIMAQTPPIPRDSQWAVFLRNHDELTLEMVTDEERLYMYRVYAQDPEARINVGIRRRLAPLLRNDRRRIELMNALLFSLPGTPVIYYGDEIGMGDNIYLGDRNGVRTPMQWGADRNAGFSRANPQQLYLPLITDHEYHYETVHVEAQQENPHSLLSWMKRMIALRKRFHSFGRGSLEFLHPENRKVLAFVRAYGDEKIMVVANLSRFAQHVELDLCRFKGMVPVELFGRVDFPPIGELPYFVTLGPHTFYWFSLAERGIQPDTGRARPIPTIVSTDGWEEVIRGELRDELAGVLSDYLHEQHWFRGRAHRILSANVIEATPIPYGRKVAYLALIRVEYAERDPETYVLPLSLATGRQAETLKRRNRGAAIARIAHQAGSRNAEGLLFDAMWDDDFPGVLLKVIASRKGLQGVAGRTTGIPTPALRQLKVPAKAAAAPRIVEGDLNNTSVVFGDRLILKLFRCVDDGINPDVEIGAFLSEQHFKHTPPLAGHIEYRGGRGRHATIAVLEQYIPHEGDGWDEAQKAVGAFLRRAARRTGAPPSVNFSTAALLELAAAEPDEAARDLMGGYLERARLLGKRTAELHLALSAGRDDAAFRPRPFTSYYQRSVYQAMRRLTGQTMFLLRRELDTLDDALAKHAQTIAGMEEAIVKRFGATLKTRIEATRTRYHGDYRLSQVLRAGDDYVFVDFEGEPDRLMAERQLKHSPLRDVASMVRSFHSAAHAPLSRRRRNGSGAEQTKRLEQWADYWAQQASAAFLGEYLRTAADASFVPRTAHMLKVLLDTLLVERALTDLQLALVSRPEGVRVPLLMLGHLLAEPDTSDN
jgi:maltose alpha-D-glucosyltransferase/alpha-amylase